MGFRDCGRDEGRRPLDPRKPFEKRLERKLFGFDR